MSDTMRSQLEDFLVELSEMYPIEKGRNFDKVISETVDYLLPVCYNKQIDFGRVKRAVFDEYKYKTFPEPKFLKDVIPRGFVSAIFSNEFAGGLVLLRLPNGYVYQFIIDGDFSIERFSKKAIEKHGIGTRVKVFHKGTEFVNGKIYRPDSDCGEELKWA